MDFEIYSKSRMDEAVKTFMMSDMTKRDVKVFYRLSRMYGILDVLRATDDLGRNPSAEAYRSMFNDLAIHGSQYSISSILDFRNEDDQ